MSVIDVVSDSLDIFRRNPIIALPYAVLFVLAIIGIIVVLAVLLIPLVSHIPRGLYNNTNASSSNSTQALNSTAQLRSMFVNALIASIPLLIILWLVFFLISVLISGMYVSMGLQGFSGNVDLGEAFKIAWRRYWSLLGLSVLVLIVVALVIGIFALILLVPLLSSILSNTSSGSPSNAVLNLVMVLLFIVIAIIVVVLSSIFFFMGYVVVIAENLGAVAAFRRSIDLGKKNFWNILFILFLSMAISIGLLVVRFILDIVPIIGPLVGLVLQILVLVWGSLFATVFYLEFVKKKTYKLGKTSAKVSK